MDKKQEERDSFWISVGPESGYLGTIAAETAHKNDGGISPDGKRLGWENACDNTTCAGGEDCDCGEDCNCGANCDCGTNCNCGENCDCGTDCNCDENRGCGEDCNDGKADPTLADAMLCGLACERASLPLPGLFPSEAGAGIPLADIGPERQNTQE